MLQEVPETTEVVLKVLCVYTDMSFFQSRVAHLGIIDILGQTTLCRENCPMDYRMFHIISSLYPQDTASTAPVMTIKNISQHYKCPWRTTDLEGGSTAFFRFPNEWRATPLVCETSHFTTGSHRYTHAGLALEFPTEWNLLSSLLWQAEWWSPHHHPSLCEVQSPKNLFLQKPLTKVSQLLMASESLKTMFKEGESETW